MKYAPYFIECSFTKNHLNQKTLNVDIWLDIEMVKQQKPDFSIENTAIDFLICPDGRTCPRVYNLHLYHEAFFEHPKQKAIRLSIKQVSNFMCYSLTDIPMTEALVIERTHIWINLFNNFHKGYEFGGSAFFHYIPLHECLTKKEVML